MLNKDKAKLALFISIPVAICVALMLVLEIPPMMVLFVDILVVFGFVLVGMIGTAIWRHELLKLDHALNNVELALEERERYEKFVEEHGKHSHHYLLAFKKGALWFAIAFIGMQKKHHPSLWKNLKTIFTEERFFAIRWLMVLWLLFFVGIVWALLK